MSVLACQFYHCNNVMCDFLLLDRYICTECIHGLARLRVDNEEDMLEIIEGLRSGTKELNSSSWADEWVAENIIRSEE